MSVSVLFLKVFINKNHINYVKVLGVETHYINFKGKPILVPGPKLAKGMVTHHEEYDIENPLAHTVIMTRAKHIKLHHTGAKRSPEAIENIRKGKRENPLSPEARWKCGSANRGKKFSEEVKRKMGEAHKGKHHSLETKRKMSESAKKAHQKYEYGFKKKKK